MDQNLSDIITLRNPLSEPFEVIYDNKSYGVIAPGQVRRFPRYLARLALKHMIDLCITREYQGNHATNDMVEREKWGKQIVLDEEVMFQPQVKSESEKLQEEVERLNKGNDLDLILARHNAQGDGGNTPVAAAVPQAPAFNPASFAPQSAPTVLPEAKEAEAPINPPAPQQPTVNLTPTDQNTTPAVETPAAPEAGTATVAPTPPVPNDGEILAPAGNPPAAPTREILYNYARTTLMMDLNDQKTMAQLDQMTIPELVETLKYEPAN